MSRPYPSYKESGVERIGHIPAHWQALPLKRRFKVVGGSTPKSEDESLWDGGIVWVTPADLSGRDSLFLNISARTITEAGLASCGTTLVPRQSIVLSTRAPIGSLAVAMVPLCTNQGCRALVRLDRAESLFFAYVLTVSKAALNVRGRGTTFLELSGDELGAFRVPVPPLEEQRAIAGFLDRETGKIDALVAEQRRLIALLKEKRQAVISHAVTKGLDPTAPMKPSGIDWLGDIPAHWSITKLGRLTTAMCDGPFGSGLKSEHYTESGVRVVRLQNIRPRAFDGTDAAFIDPVYYETSLSGHDVRSGDLLIAGLGDDRNTVGRACVAPPDIAPAMVKADCFRFRLDLASIRPGFASLQLNTSAKCDAGVLSSGSTRSRISLSTMASRVVAFPPTGEQERIEEFAEQQTAKLDALISEAETAIALLQERRSALISAAVTGKIDVRGLAAGATEAA